MYSTNDFRKGLKVEMEGVPFVIVEYQFVSPGKGGAFVRTKLRNMLNGNVLERTFKSGDKVDKADLEQHEFQYLYKEGEHFVFMNNANYEQTHLDESMLGRAKDFLKENTVIQILFHNGRPIGVDLPTFVEVTIARTEPGFKGDTATNASKPAVVDTGGTIMVPLHIKEGDVVKVDTRDFSYSEKVNR